MKQTLTDAIKQAAVETSPIITAHLRGQAREHGWPEHIVNNLHVSFDGFGHQVHVPEEHQAEFHKLEYGDEHTRPTAAMRKYDNSGVAGNILAKSIDHKLGGHL